MSSTKANSNEGEIAPDDRDALLEVAQSSILCGLRVNRPLAVDPNSFSVALRELRASFVTLRASPQLRGCVGSVKASRPLVADTAENAFNAAFRDPRFPPLTPHEFPTLTIDVSVLSPMHPLEFRSEAHLLEQIDPGIDGLEIECGASRGLLLPSVWEHLPDKRRFLQALKVKAGLPATFWSDRLIVNSYTTESFGRKVLPFQEQRL